MLGLANGCFQLLHLGHIHFLRQCAKQCDYLIVAVNSDASVLRLGKRLVEPLHKRIENVHKYAGSVIPFEGDVDGLLMHIRPNILFKGYDHSDSSVMGIRKPGWKNGAGMDIVQVIQISHLQGYSTTRILNEAESSTSPRA